MRIALYEPELRTAGITAYIFNVRDGLRAIGVDADVITFNKSGRARKLKQEGDMPSQRTGWHTWRQEADITAKFSAAGEILDSYDYVHMVEPKCGTLDRRALRERKNGAEDALPEYIEVLNSTSTPWFSTLHAPQYAGSLAPFLDETLKAGNFMGLFFAHQQDTTVGAPVLDDAKTLTWPFLPYAPVHAVDDPIPPLGTIGSHGRFTWNKGGPTLALHLEKVPEDWRVELWGAESGGAGPSVSFFLYEILRRNLEWNGERTGKPGSPRDDIDNYGDVIAAWPWWAKQDGGPMVKYMGRYLSGVRVCEHFTVACLLTSGDFAKGFELTSMEAADAGSLLVMPRYALWNEAGYRVKVLEHFEGTLTFSSAKGPRWDMFKGGETASNELRNSLGEIVRAAEGIGGRKWHTEVARHNREILYDKHHPSKFAEFLVQEVTTHA